MLRLDHLAVSARNLDEGVAAVEFALGVPLLPGGKHGLMSTHNRLLGLGDIYLEVIAADPDAPPPGRPRWFDLDSFAGKPRLTNWICAAGDLDAVLGDCPPGTGVAHDLERGDLRWRMAIPDDGRLPFDGAFPALIQWLGPAHPVQRLPESGVRLEMLEIAHPRAEALRAALAGKLDDPRVTFCAGTEKAMRATFHTPHGKRYLE